MPRVLLIVDDRKDVGAAFMRYFRRHFDSVHLAATPAEAEALLAATPAPTHLICDYWLGAGHPVGSTLIEKWRRAFPGLERAVLVSGSEVEEIACPAGVDGVFGKPADLAAIRERLLS